MTLCGELCENSSTDRVAVRVVDFVGRRKHVLGGVHTGATWRIPLNHPCAAAMQPFCQIALTTCLKSVHSPTLKFAWLPTSVSNAFAKYKIPRHCNHDLSTVHVNGTQYFASPALLTKTGDGVTRHSSVIVHFSPLSTMLDDFELVMVPKVILLCATCMPNSNYASHL